MSDLRVRGELRRAISLRWGDRVHTTPIHGDTYVPPVRAGGMTDALINLAVETAMGFIDNAWDDGFAAGVDAASED